MTRLQTGNWATDIQESAESLQNARPSSALGWGKQISSAANTLLTQPLQDKDENRLRDRLRESSTKLEAFTDQLFKDAPTDVSKLRRYNQIRRKNDLDEVADLPPETTAGEALQDVGEGIASGRETPFAGDVLQAFDLFDIIEAAENAESGKATTREWEKLADFQEEMAKKARGASIGADIVTGISESAQFAIEFALSGGLFSAGKKLVLKGATAGAKQAAKTTVSSVIKKAITGAAGRTPFFAPRISAGAAERMVPGFRADADETGPLRMVVGRKGESLPKAVANAGLDTVIELFSEGTGEVLGIVARPLKRVAGKVVGDKVANFRMPAREFLEKFGYSTLPGELAEERIGATLRTAATELSKASGFDVINLPDNIIPTPREFAVEAGVLGVLGGGGSAIGSALQPKPPGPLNTPEDVQAFATDNPEVVKSILDTAEKLASGTPNAKTFEEAGIPKTTRSHRKRITEAFRGISKSGATAQSSETDDSRFRPPTQSAAPDSKPSEATKRPPPTDQVSEPTVPPEDPVSPESPIPRALPVRLTAPAAVKSMNAPTVLRGLEQTLGGFDLQAPIRSGNTGVSKNKKSRKPAGVFKVPEAVIRIRTANDIGTALHEFGHAIEYAAFSKEKAGVLANAARESSLTSELEALGKDLYTETIPPNGYMSEGFAEFVYLYMADPNEAKRRAPKTYAWFEARFLKSFPIGNKLLQKTKDQVQRFVNQGALSRVDQTLIDPSSLAYRARTFLAKVGDRRSAVRTAKQIKSAVLTAGLDSFQPILDFVREVEQQVGHKLEHGENPFLDASALNRVHEGRFTYMVDSGMIDFNAMPTGGPSLKEVGSLMSGARRKRDLDLYLYAKRSIALLTPTEKYPQGRNPGITIEDAAQLVDELDERYGSRIQQAAAKYIEWNEGILNYVAQASPEFAETIRRVREDDPGWYVPLHREFEQLDDINAAIYKSGSNATRATISKRLKGSGRRVIAPLDVAASQARNLIRAAHERFVLDEIFKLAKVPGFGHLVEEVPNSTPDTFAFVVDGETKHFVIDQRLKKALDFQSPYARNMNLFVDWLGRKPARFNRLMNTGARASFALIRNPIIDVPTAIIQSQASGNSFAFFYQFMKSVMANGLDISGIHRSRFRDLELRLGGMVAQPLLFEKDISKAAIRKAFQGPVVTFADPRNWFEKALEVLQITESAARQAEIRQLAKDINWSPGQPMTTNQSMRLLLAFKRVTTDFSAAGHWARYWSSLSPFLNASIQGPRRTLARIRENPKTILKAVGAITFPTLALWWRNKDEDWYQEIPAKERSLYWFIRTPWPVDTLVRIPRPFEIGQFFAALPEALLNAVYREDPSLVTEWFPQVWDVMVPDPRPVLLREAQQQLRGEGGFDDFWDSPIVSRSLQKLPAAEQVGPYTTRVSQFLGDMFDVSPMRIDHAIRGVGGGASFDLVATLGVGPTSIERDGEEADLPVVGRLFKRGGVTPSGRRTFDKMYDLLDEAQSRKASKRIRETPEQRQERLLLTDTARAVGNLMYARAYAPEVDRRKKLVTEAVDIAKQTLAQLDKGTQHRGGAKAKRKKTEPDRLVARFRAMDLTTRQQMLKRFSEDWVDAGKKARGKAYNNALLGLARAMNDAGVK